MDKSTKITIIIGSIIVLLIVPVVTILVLTKPKSTDTSSQNTNQSAAKAPNRSDEELTAAILKGTSDLTDSDGKPIFTIDSVKKPVDRWYVLKLYTLSDTEKTNPAKVLLYDSASEGLTFIMGPGTSFPQEQTQAKGVPGSVAKELNS